MPNLQDNSKPTWRMSSCRQTEVRKENNVLNFRHSPDCVNRFDLQTKHHGQRGHDSRRRKRNVPRPSANRGNVHNQQKEIEIEKTRSISKSTANKCLATAPSNFSLFYREQDNLPI